MKFFAALLLVFPCLADSLTFTNQGVVPVMKGAQHNPVLCLKSQADEAGDIKGLRLKVSPAKAVKSVRLVSGGADGFILPKDAEAVATASPDAEGRVSFKSDIPVNQGDTHLWFDVELTDKVPVGSKIQISHAQAQMGQQKAKMETPSVHRVGYMLAFCDDEVKQLDGSMRKCNDFRIPGLITTKDGTLVGSFDARYDGWVDLCADIDVATVRSTDGGQTWSNPSVSLDIGAGADNGCGDACIVQDSKGRIWLQALGCHFGGGRCNRISQAGFDPKKTGQWYMTYSDDDGQTWSRELVNATKQLKKEEWVYLLAGPGRGITLKDGTIVFPAQFRQDEPKKMGTSMLCYSKDNGKTWQASKPSFPNASEAQIVELSDGSIMINCRAGKGQKARSVYVTKDLGETWERHESNAKALSEPSCQASIIAVDSPKYGRVLLFSNPVNTGIRRQLSIRYSLDEGKTWQLGAEYDSREGGGYSCLTMIDKNHVGLFYETSKGHGKGSKYLGIGFLSFSVDEILTAEK